MTRNMRILVYVAAAALALRGLILAIDGIDVALKRRRLYSE
ncbi:MAG: hypothetical protein ACOCUW_00405 [Gemmatimonadota bacterium]